MSGIDELPRKVWPETQDLLGQMVYADTRAGCER
jgi:hypothetical protein